MNTIYDISNQILKKKTQIQSTFINPIFQLNWLMEMEDDGAAYVTRDDTYLFIFIDFYSLIFFFTFRAHREFQFPMPRRRCRTRAENDSPAAVNFFFLPSSAPRVA